MNNIWILQLGLLLVSGCVISSQMVNSESYPAMVESTVTGWYQIEGTNLLEFDYVLYNYGDVEAKNVVTECKVYDLSANPLYTFKDSPQNIASRSYTDKEFMEDIPSGMNPNREYIIFCHVDSCEGDCVNLMDRIDGLEDL